MNPAQILLYALRIQNKAFTKLGGIAPPVVRVALAWLRQASGAETDAFMRLQFMERAAENAGIPIRKKSWAAKGTRGLAEAQGALSEFNINPFWFSKRNTGMYDTILGKMQFMLSKSGIPATDAEDIMMNELFGNKPLLEHHNVHPDNMETPQSMANGKAFHPFKLRTLDAIRAHNREQKYRGPEVQDNEGGQIPDQKEIEPALGILELLTDRHSSLGKKLQDVMRDGWADKKSKVRNALDSWLDQYIVTGKHPHSATYAQSIDVAPSTFRQRYIKPAFMTFFKNVVKDRSLSKKLEEFYLAQGVILELPSNEAELVKRWQRLATVQMVSDSFQGLPL